jgi:hypothetical protein
VLIILIGIVILFVGIFIGYSFCKDKYKVEIAFYNKYHRYEHPNGCFISPENLNKDIDRIIDGKR